MKDSERLEKSNGISERPSAKTNDDFERIKLENDDFRHIIQTLQSKINELDLRQKQLEKSQEATASGVYLGIDNLTQFINEIQENQLEQSKKIKFLENNQTKENGEVEKSGDKKPTAKPRVKTVAAPVIPEESPREKRKESTESSGDSKNIQYVTVKSNKFQETESDEEKLKKEEKKRKDNAKARDRRKMRLHNFRKALENLDETARSAFRSPKKNKEKNQTITPRVSAAKITAETDKKSESKFVPIKAVHDVPPEPEQINEFARQGSLRSIQRREEILKKLKLKKELPEPIQAEFTVGNKPILNPENIDMPPPAVEPRKFLYGTPTVAVKVELEKDSNVIKLVEEIVESSDSLLPIDEFNSGDNRKIKDQNSIIDVVKPMEEEDDLAIGLPKHDYKTLSNTPKMKEFSPRKIIEPYDYDKARKELNKDTSKSGFTSKLIDKRRLSSGSRMGSFEPIVEEPKEEKSAEMSNDPTILIEDDIQPTPFVRPIQRRNFGRPKSTRPLSENIGYNEDLLEKLEEPALRRIMSLGPEERFKRSSLRRKKFFLGET